MFRAARQNTGNSGSGEWKPEPNDLFEKSFCRQAAGVIGFDMPELAEVDFFRKQWNPGLRKQVQTVKLIAKSRVLRDTNAKVLKEMLEGGSLLSSASKGKQMLFGFSGGAIPAGSSAWLGVHLGMAGKLRYVEGVYSPEKHDHLVLDISGGALVYTDTRHFGKLLFEVGKREPEYWLKLAPEILSSDFTKGELVSFLLRRKKSPIKGVLLMQERFPGVGNWMADEILWRAEIHPARLAGSLTESEVSRLFKETRFVCRGAMKTVGETYEDPPKTWLFQHRWKDGGICPKTKEPLVRETIAGRTTCYSPSRQPL